MPLLPPIAASKGPPSDWQPEEVWTALSERPKPSAVIEMPCKTYRGQPLSQIRIQVLRRDEQTMARVAARKTVLSKGFASSDLDDDPIARELLQTYSALETLAVAIRSVKGAGPVKIDGIEVEHYGRIFRDGLDLERMLSDDEITVLWTQYLAVQRERGPLYSGGMSRDEVDAWIATLAAAADTIPLARCTWPQLAELCLSLAQRAAKSTGSNPDSSPSQVLLNGQESPLATSQTGTSSNGVVPAGPGLSSSTPDDGSVPDGAEPNEAASIVREFTDN